MSARVALGVAAAGLLFGAGACYPGSISDIGEADLVITARDTLFRFEPGTYAMPDSIVRVGDGNEGDINREYDREILDKVAAEFERMGYERIFEDSPTAPDYVVFVGANSSTYDWWIPGGWWGGWGWYPGWGPWYPGWGGGYYPGYPWYPPIYGGSYSTGTLFIGMIDPDAPAIGNELKGVWGGIVNGLLSSSTETTARRAVELVEQVFRQSPYLAGPSGN